MQFESCAHHSLSSYFIWEKGTHPFNREKMPLDRDDARERNRYGLCSCWFLLEIRFFVVIKKCKPPTLSYVVDVCLMIFKAWICFFSRQATAYTHLLFWYKTARSENKEQFYKHKWALLPWTKSCFLWKPIWIAWAQMSCRGGSSSSNNHLCFSYLNVTAEKCCLLYQCQKKLVFIQSRLPLLGSWKCIPWCEILQIKAHGFMITWMHPDEQWLSLDYVYSSLPHFIFPLGYSMKWSIAAWHAEKPGFSTCPELVLWSSLCKSLWFCEMKQPF